MTSPFEGSNLREVIENASVTVTDYLPVHRASLTIAHNDHKTVYAPIARYAEEIDDEQWATPTSRQRCIQSDTIWELQWYPATPIGFYKIAGASLAEILCAGAEWALRAESES